MHAIELFQLAAMVAVHGRLVIQSRVKFPDAALEVYWTASKCRQERWARQLKAFSATSIESTTCEGAAVATHCEPILDEILLTEVLSRVWAAICRASDRVRGIEDAGPVATSVLAGHLEARHRVLNLMVYGYGVGVEEAVGLNRRRLRIEHSTDMLLSFVASRDVSHFAFEPRRVKQWAKSAPKKRRLRGNELGTILSLTMLQGSPWKTARPHTDNGDLNRQIGSSILGCLPTAIFDSLGLPISPLQLSLLQGTADSRGRLNLERRNQASRISSEDTGWLGFRGDRPS